MRSSSARLSLGSNGSTPTVKHASAEAPQRWTFGRPGDGDWADITHQLLGDGVFGGDHLRTVITAGRSVRATVRGIAATAVRAGDNSMSATLVRVEAAGALAYLPGTVVPHSGASHSNLLRVDVSEGGRALILCSLVAGRLAMDEYGAFQRLRMRSAFRSGCQVAFQDDTTLSGADIRAQPKFGVLVTGAALGFDVGDVGDWPGSAPNGAVVAVSALRAGGNAIRGTFETLGDAQRFMGSAEEWFKGAVRRRTYGDY